MNVNFFLDFVSLANNPKTFQQYTSPIFGYQTKCNKIINTLSGLITGNFKVF